MARVAEGYYIGEQQRTNLLVTFMSRHFGGEAQKTSSAPTPLMVARIGDPTLSYWPGL